MPWSDRFGDDSARKCMLGPGRRYPGLVINTRLVPGNYMRVSQVRMGVRLKRRICDVPARRSRCGFGHGAFRQQGQELCRVAGQFNIREAGDEVPKRYRLIE